MIRILVVDDHHAVRAGLMAVLRGEPGLVPQAAVGTAREGLAELERVRPDVAIVDYQLPDEDGLQLCLRLKSRAPELAVLIYSGFATTQLAIPAIVAGADGVASKGAPADELFEAIRLVASGRSVLPPVPHELLERCGTKLADDDLPIFGMAMDRTPTAEMADALRLDEHAVTERIERMLVKLA